MAVKTPTTYDRIRGNYQGMVIYAVTFTTANTSNPTAAATEGVTVTRTGVGAFRVTFDVAPKNFFAVLPSADITASGTEGLKWVGGDYVGLTYLDFEYHSADGTEADTTGVLCNVVIICGYTDQAQGAVSA